MKIKYVKSIKYKLEDFVYMYVIHYKLLYVVSAIILKSSVFWSIFSYYFNRNVAIAGALKKYTLNHEYHKKKEPPFYWRFPYV